MTHTAGFTYGFFGDTPVDRMYREKGVWTSKSLDEFVNAWPPFRCCISREHAGFTAHPSIFRAI